MSAIEMVGTIQVICGVVVGIGLQAVGLWFVIQMAVKGFEAGRVDQMRQQARSYELKQQWVETAPKKGKEGNGIHAG